MGDVTDSIGGGGIFGDVLGSLGYGPNMEQAFEHNADRWGMVLGTNDQGQGLNLAPSLVNAGFAYGTSGLLNTNVVDNLFTGNEGDAALGAAEGYGLNYLQSGSGGADVGDGTNLFAGDTPGNYSNVGGGGIDPSTGVSAPPPDPYGAGSGFGQDTLPAMGLPSDTGVGGAPGGVTDPSASFISTSSADPTPLTPQLAQQLGIAAPLGTDMSVTPVDAGGGGLPEGGGTNLFASDQPGGFSNVGGGGSDLPGGSTTGGDNDFMRWLGKHKGLTGMLGLSALNAFKQPKLPGAARSAQDSANASIGQANQTIATGGMGPQWAQQKATIDQSIDQQIQQATEQMMQQAINSGMGANSGVTAQKISQLRAQLETQRQQLYMQAQQQNVQNAIRVLSGDNQVLMNIGNMQMQQSEEARNAAMETARLALMLGGLG